MTIEELRKSGMIAYEYIRGSHAYGLNTPDSDEDRGGVFICPPEMLLGLRSGYVEQVADEKGDTVFYEFGRWIELLCKSNPTALESLFVPKRCIVGEVHPMIKKVMENREMFLSKECFKTLTGYAVSQIMKAKGLNKKIVNPVTERKTPMDFCHVPNGLGGSQKLSEWLRKKGYLANYCGLAKMDGMNDLYALYYDWGNHLIHEFNTLMGCQVDIHDSSIAWELANQLEYRDFGQSLRNDYPKWMPSLMSTIMECEPYGFSGIINMDGTSNEVRLSSIPKGLKPLTYVSYNQNGYESHCRRYKEYQDWVKHRNPVRYENNLGHNYDAKNLMHTMRLLKMGTELAEGKGLNIDRTNIDKDFLMKIRNHEMSYEEIVSMATAEKAKMEEAAKVSKLPDIISMDKVNKLLIELRKEHYHI